MQSKSNVLCLYLIILFFGCKDPVDRNPVDYVDPFIGVRDGEISNCVLGPQMPFGSINPSPHTPGGSHDGYSVDQPIRGFGQLHASGTGWGKYGMGFISPQIGLNIDPEGHDSPKSKERASAFEYSVYLDRFDIQVSVSPSFHSAIYRLEYPKNDSSTLVFDVTHNIPMHIASFIGGEVDEAEVSIHPDGKVTGSGRYTGGFGDGRYRVFFSAEASKKPASTGRFINDSILDGPGSIKLQNLNDHVGAYFHFNTKEREEVFFKIAISFKSISQAEKWLNEEIPEWNYQGVKQQAYQAWDKELNKIRIETEDSVSKTIFYTALYHTIIMPRDRTDDMTGFEEGEILWDDHYAGWDTWRTNFPLMVLIHPERVSSNINSFINRLKVNGRVKDTYIAGLDMAADQGGDNVDNIIADAYVKGISGINWENAWKVLKNNAENERNGFQGFGNFGIQDSVMALYRTRGWIPAGVMSTSKTLEYAYNDFCVAQVAKGLGKEEDYEKYLERSGQWIHLWDSNAMSDGFRGFIASRDSAYNMLDIDLCKLAGSWKDFFYESNSWTYSYFVPHQFNKLIELCGGSEKYVERTLHGLTKDYINYDNEPAFLVIHSMHYAGRPDLVKYRVDELMNKRFTTEGYPGNEDSGAMGSWYVFSAMGFFPNAGQDIYYLHGPRYKKVVIQLPEQKQIIITAEELSKENSYVQSCFLNGKVWDQSWLRHSDIADGAKIHFVMGAEPSSWGKGNNIPSLD